jgi:hypothetical protein
MHWDGTSWKAISGLDLPGDSILTSIAAVSHDDLWAIGSSSDATLILHTEPPAAPPDKPTLISPENNAILSQPEVTLDWLGVNCASRYQVVVKLTSSKGPTVDQQMNLSISQYTYAAKLRMSLSVPYFWHVRACNNIGCSAWSPWRRFVIVPR